MGRIYYLVDQRRIAGGIKVAYRHVATLRRNGLDAVIVHRVAERPDWFAAPDVPVAAFSELAFEAADVVVVPEDARHSLRTMARLPPRKVMFCQNHFYLASGLVESSDLRGFGIEAVMTSGDEITGFLRWRLPDLPLSTVHLAIDPEIYRPLPDKRLQFAAVPRKRPYEYRFIRDMVSFGYPASERFGWVELTDASEAEVAQAMAGSAVFLSLARLEGVGLTGLEAMACGCAVAGFLGGGGREFATAENGWWAPDDDCVAAARQLAACLEAVLDGAAATRVAAGRATAARYTLEREESELLAFWHGFLG